MLYTARLFSVSYQLPNFSTFTNGNFGTKEWRLFFKCLNNSRTVSAWHDIPRQPAYCSNRDRDHKSDHIFTYVNEIPRGSRAKMELIKEEAYNPIAQDTFNKAPGCPLRFFSYGNIPFNYGFIPQTWENPDVLDKETKCFGDGDPIDVVQLGPTPEAIGNFMPVRVLGVLGLIDQNQTDWKIIVEPIAIGGETYGSLERVPMEVQRQIVDWFRNYKTTEGKPPNEFVFNAEIRGVETALQILLNGGNEYEQLFSKRIDSHSYWLP
ncbi:unnamed protein product [Phytomonas sp. EM1]|nr:unnamed protein product [Phytomonas sp. EM1]|eukprot:CCW61470.1 unnamed protein product [Phytomonas sp. isolate EM1]